MQDAVFLIVEGDMGSLTAHLDLAYSCIAVEFINSENNLGGPAKEHRAALMAENSKITIWNPKCIPLA